MVKFVELIRWRKGGKFVKRGTKGAKRAVYLVETAKLKASGKKGGKARWYKSRPYVKKVIAKKARVEREKEKRRNRREYLALKRRDKTLSRLGRAEYIKGEVERHPFTRSKDGSFRWREFNLPDVEIDTMQYAIGRVSRWFEYPVICTIGIKGFDKDGNNCGRFKDNTLYTNVLVLSSSTMVEKLHSAARELMARYSIDLIQQVFIHISESKTVSNDRSR